VELEPNPKLEFLKKKKTNKQTHAPNASGKK
jgi:hypothetical protein